MLGNREPTDVSTGVSSGKLACGDSLAEGGPVASVDVASRLCDKEGNTSAMLVLDDELVLFVTHALIRPMAITQPSCFTVSDATLRLLPCGKQSRKQSRRRALT